jgi:hypothetical protein
LLLCCVSSAATEPRFQITLALDIDSISPGSSARVAFETDFVRDMAAALGVEESTIRIIDITAGSVAVTFEVVSPPADLAVEDFLATARPEIAGVQFEFVAAISHSEDAPPPPAYGGQESVASSAGGGGGTVAANAAFASAVPSATVFIGAALSAAAVLSW